jgi:hypothetical protein
LETKTEVEYKSGLTRRVIILSLITMPIAIFFSLLLWDLSSKPYTYSGFFIGYFWLVLLNEAVGKINKKWKLTPQEFVVYSIPFFLATGVSFIEKGTPNEGLVKGWCSATGLVPAVYALNTEPYSSDWKSAFPTFWAPQDSAIVKAYWNGLLPGQFLDWGAWLGPMVFWYLFWISWVVLGLSWGYVFRKVFIEVEHLPFVPSIPISYTIEAGVSETPRLFNFRDPWSKTFWVFFIIGLIVSLQPVLAEVMPILPVGAAWWGEQSLDLSQYTRGFWPGADFSAVFHTTQTALWLLVGTDVLITAIISWIVFQLIYNTIVIWTGLVPYEPGIESFSCWSIGYQPPLHYSWFGTTGILVGVGVWTFITAWPHIKRYLSALKGPDIIEQGMSIRSTWLLIISSVILWGGLWIISGIPIYLYLIFIVLWIIWIVASTRIVGEVWYHMPVATPLIWPYLWYTGAGLGAWPNTVPNSDPIAIRTMFLTSTSTFWTPRFQSNSMFMSENYYRIADINKTKAGDVFKWLIVMSLYGALIAIPLGVWLSNLKGLSSFTGDNWESGGVVWAAGASNIESSEYFPTSYSIGTHVLYTIAGIILTIAIYLLRARYAWFMINPAALAVSLWLNEYMWLNAVVALIIKTIVIRIGGVRLLEERAIPAVTGFCTGFGALFLVAALKTLIVEVLPLLII